MLVLGLALGAALLIPGTVWTVQWVKSNKQHAREERKRLEFAEKEQNRKVTRFDPSSYVAVCKKPFWALFQANISCEIKSESYRELRLWPE